MTAACAPLRAGLSLRRDPVATAHNAIPPAPPVNERAAIQSHQTPTHLALRTKGFFGLI